MYVVIFRSTRSIENSDLYSEWSEKMEQLVACEPGYQSHFSFRDRETREGVTVSYFDSEDSVRRWHQNAEHIEAQELGKTHFYLSFKVEVAEIKRQYEWRR